MWYVYIAGSPKPAKGTTDILVEKAIAYVRSEEGQRNYLVLIDEPGFFMWMDKVERTLITYVKQPD